MGNALKKDQTSVRDNPGIRLSLMGSEGSGKTCFFAGLAWLGSAVQRSNFVVIGRNEASQAFVKDLRDTLARNELPQSTRKTDALALDVLYKNARIGIDIENFAGEEFRAVGTELQADSPLFSRFRESRYLVLFLDIENDVDRESQTSSERLDAVLNLLSTEKLCDGSRKLAIVLTKADLRGITKENATPAAARDYLKSHKQALFEKIEGLGYEKEFFFLAPIGRTSLADGKPPAPFGYEALFSWLVGDIRNENARSWIQRHWIPLVIAGVTILLAAGIGIDRYRRTQWANKVLGGEAQTHTSEEITKALKYGSQEKKDMFVDMGIEKIRLSLPSVDSLTGLDELQINVAKLEGVGNEPIEKRLAELKMAIRERREDIHLARILALQKQNYIAKCREAIANYHLDTNAARRRMSEVKQIAAHLDTAEQNRKRAEIRAANVEVGNLGTLKTRCDLVANFPFPNAATKKEATRAVAIGRLFLSDSPYHIEIKTAKGLPSAHQTRLELFNLGPSAMQQMETDLVKSRNPQWNKPFSLRWKPGDKMRIVWWWKSKVPMTPSTEIGTKTFDDPWTSLLDMLGGVKLNPKLGAGHARLKGETPEATIICDEFPEPKEDLKVFRKFIVPGTYWQD